MNANLQRILELQDLIDGRGIWLVYAQDALARCLHDGQREALLARIASCQDARVTLEAELTERQRRERAALVA